MKSKLIYTLAEANEILSLIKEKLKVDAAKQKGIRAKIRSRGFWASEFGFRDGYTVQNFLSVVNIIGGKTIVSDKPTLKGKFFQNEFTRWIGNHYQEARVTKTM